MHFPPFDASISLDMPFHCPIQPNQFHAALIFRLATVVSIDDNFLLLDRPIHAERDIFSKCSSPLQLHGNEEKNMNFRAKNRDFV